MIKGFADLGDKADLLQKIPPLGIQMQRLEDPLQALVRYRL